ncbi:SDR family NAD(P)-dependent oxidoreductase [Amycolatopsis sp. Hca4]|uniref:SDR family NAD(P)-dependent oxidoreductase n=1 Tax=Amycolatopsis sp. Hca4 TaxID=2742131 RepID=UPI0015929B9B|nr:SDR family oxidoreductase [Amycolatopsis sp. Hca4]QKV74060.1 SDR family oxidoreductase [Amycolatopsis sp. Hca4]
MRESTVLVTGGGKGLGKAFTEALGRAGARVFITGRDGPSLDATVAELTGRGLLVEAMRADVVDSGAMADAVARITAASGRLDVLVNNAVAAGPLGPTAEVDLDAWWYAQQVNVAGPLVAAQAALKVMLPQGRGRIINLVSPAGITRWPNATAYSVSKAALIKLSENLATELRRTGIAVFSYNPGLVDAGLTRAGIDSVGTTTDPWLERVGRWARKARDAGEFVPLDTVVGTLVRLASGHADALSGQIVHAQDDLEARIAEREGATGC